MSFHCVSIEFFDAFPFNSNLWQEKKQSSPKARCKYTITHTVCFIKDVICSGRKFRMLFQPETVDPVNFSCPVKFMGPENRSIDANNFGVAREI